MTHAAWPDAADPGRAGSRPWRRWRLAAVLGAALGLCSVLAAPVRDPFPTPELMPPRLDGPVDWGPGPGWPRALGPQVPPLRPLAVPIGPGDAHLKGVFGPAFAWSLIPLHSVLLADGRVLYFGTGPDGLQGARMHYAVWNPALGTGDASMQLLPNTTGTDIFCAGQTLLPGSGDVLLVGGDRTYRGVRNYGNNDVNRFSPLNNSLTQESPMAWQRWYATVVTNAQGEQVTLGGLIDRAYTFNDGSSTVASHASTPEVYLSGVGWRTLSSATNEQAYGGLYGSWSYPRAWLAPDGRIAIITPHGEVYALDSDGSGTLERTLASGLGAGRHILPAVMFQPGKVLSLRLNGVAKVVDLNTNPPGVSPAGSLSLERKYGNATVLADGKVFVNGGSSVGNTLDGAAFHTEIWDPASGAWAITATAAKPRLYHSTSLLLPDGTVLTNGGGAPGPVNNLNGEIYYPPYLYHPDGSGRPARRLVVASAPQAGTWGQALQLEMADLRSVARVTLVRFGAVTHAFHSDQRFQELGFAQRGKRLSFQLPASAQIAPPGFYMLFVLDAAGVPSVAKVIHIG